MTMPKFEPVAAMFADEDVTKFIKRHTSHLRHKGKWHELYTIDQLTEAHEAGKRNAIPEGWVLVPKGVFVIDSGFKRNGTEATPALLIGFDDNDYDTRDSFKAKLLAAAPKGEE